MKTVLHFSAVALVSVAAVMSSYLVAEAKSKAYSRCVGVDDLETNDDFDCQVAAGKDGAPCYCLFDGRKIKGKIRN